MPLTLLHPRYKQEGPPRFLALPRSKARLSKRNRAESNFLLGGV